MSHVLVIGGTGMLSGVTLYLLEKFDTVSVIARRHTGFSRLDNFAGKNKNRINRLQLDYTNYVELTNSIMKSIDEFGEISLCASWVHSNAPMANVITAKTINEMFAAVKFKIADSCDFYEILGSSYANPENKSNNRQDEFIMFDYINYHSVILGFIISNGKSRWLTNEEISSGVNYAINRKINKFIVGTVEPWDKIP